MLPPHGRSRRSGLHPWWLDVKAVLSIATAVPVIIPRAGSAFSDHWVKSHPERINRPQPKKVRELPISVRAGPEPSNHCYTKFHSTMKDVTRKAYKSCTTNNAGQFCCRPQCPHSMVAHYGHGFTRDGIGPRHAFMACITNNAGHFVFLSSVPPTAWSLTQVMVAPMADKSPS